MKRKHNFLFAAWVSMFLCFFTGEVFSQQNTVSGKVTDAATGVGIPGTNITVQGTTTGAISDENGDFTIQVPSGDAVLEFSFVGYISQTIPLEGRTIINVTLEEDLILLDELVVVGYGTQRKSDLTGAVAVVKSDDIEKVATNHISKALQGQATGVQVHGSGEPGANPVIKIRGISSFRNNGPLYVIDGIPVGGTADFTTADIESIQVLKDASSSAIYGARGANGVIIITTKRGKPGGMRVTYDGYFGVQNVVKRMDVTNRVQFQEMNNLARTNDRSWPAPANDSSYAVFEDSIDTDWQKEAFKTGYINEHTLTISGGSEFSNYSVMLNYFDQTGTIDGPGPAYTRYAFRVNSDTKKGRFKFGESMYYSYSDKINLTFSQWGNTMVDLVLAAPTIPVYDENNLGGYGGARDNIHAQIIPNVIAFNNLFESNSIRNRFLGMVYGEMEIVQGLNFRTNLSFDRTDWRDTYFFPQFYVGDRYQNSIAYLDDTRGDHYIMLMESTLNFAREFGDHRIGALAGYTAQYSRWQQISGHAEGYEEPYFRVIDAGPNDTKSVSGSMSESSLVSWLGRINYAYADRYLLTANFRRDGSSKFGPAYRWGNFPSLALGWKIHNEGFFNVDFVSTLKLRAGIGIIGNQQSVPNYQYASYINNYPTYVFGNQLPLAAIQTQMSSADIHWEEKNTKNIGVDASFFNNSLEFTAEYYYNHSYDLLHDIPIPLSNGSLNNPYINGASMLNQGFEFMVSYRHLEGDFHYTVSANATTLSNEVLSLGTIDIPIETYMSRTEVGQPIGQIYGWDFIGIFQNFDEVDDHADQEPETQPGDCIFRDINGVDENNNIIYGEPDGSIGDEDRMYLGSAIPKVTGGINITMDYKGFDLAVFMYGVYGNLINNRIYWNLNNYKLGNYSIEAFENYWRGEGTTDDYPRPSENDPNRNERMSARWLQDGSYLRIQNLQIGYTFPAGVLQKVPGVQGLRIYVGSQNLFTLTKYEGFDPDIGNDGLFYRGQDNGSYPSPRTFMIGARLSL
jgi:TonB-linked SusC/RagA family outer membrane protein